MIAMLLFLSLSYVALYVLSFVLFLSVFVSTFTARGIAPRVTSSPLLSSNLNSGTLLW